MKLFAVGLAVLFASLSVQAYIIHLDGHADAYPALADHALIVLSKRVSGTPGSELLALDTPTGRVLWRQKSNHFVYRTNTTPGILCHVRALLIDGSGPRLIRAIDLAAGKQTSATVQLLADRDVLVQVLGALDLPEMQAPTQDHTLTTRLVSLTDAREIWRHDEKVTIRKEN